MAGTGDDAPLRGALSRIGFEAGQVVQEFGWDDDVDEQVRATIEGIVGSPLEDEDYGDGADAVLLWFRDGDDDLVDAIVDGLTGLVEHGALVLCTPRAGRDGHVEPSDIEDAAVTAGLHPSGHANVSKGWSLTRLLAPKTHRR